MRYKFVFCLRNNRANVLRGLKIVFGIIFV